jgi:hypothetical protein
VDSVSQLFPKGKKCLFTVLNKKAIRKYLHTLQVWLGRYVQLLTFRDIKCLILLQRFKVCGQNDSRANMSIALFMDGHMVNKKYIRRGNDARWEGVRVSGDTVLPFNFCDLELVGA